MRICARLVKSRIGSGLGARTPFWATQMTREDKIVLIRGVSFDIGRFRLWV
jgi:hypothetical protein